MAKLSVYLIVLALVLLILTCVEGDKPRRGKNKPDNRQKNNPQKIRTEIERYDEKHGRGNEFKYTLDYYMFEQPAFNYFSYIKLYLWYMYNGRKYGLNPSDWTSFYYSSKIDQAINSNIYWAYADSFKYINTKYGPQIRPDPWMEGPNVCKKETMENITATAKDKRNYVHIFDFSTHNINTRTCEEYRNMFKCTLVVPVQSSGEIKDPVVVMLNERFSRYVAPNGRTYRLVYECCHGYDREGNDYGCPIRRNDSDLIEKAEELRLTDFLKAVKNLQIKNELQSENFTLFVPKNGAYNLDSDLIDAGARLLLKEESTVIELSDEAVKQSLKSIKNVFLSHMVPGIIKINFTEDNDLLLTAGSNNATIRINHFYRPKKMMTANCAPIRTSDIASNGYIQIVDKVLKPVTQSLMDIISSRQELSTLKTLLANTSYASKLNQDGHLTILAPTNSAVDKMSPPDLRDGLAEDGIRMEKFFQNHMIPNVLCARAIKGELKTMNYLHKYINITRTKDKKIFFNDAQVVQSDVMATNGVIHIIDKALVTDLVLGFEQILEKEGQTEFVKLTKKMGLLTDIEGKRNITVFVPSNEATKNLDGVIMDYWSKRPNLDLQSFQREVLNFHISPTLRNITSSTTLTTLVNKVIRIRTPTDSQNGTTIVQCTPIGKMNIEYYGGLINVINQAMIPPDGNVMDVLSQNKDYFKFVSLIRNSSLVEYLQGEGPITVFAPINEAFDGFDKRFLKKLSKKTNRLDRFIKRHIKTGMVCCSDISQTPMKDDAMNYSDDGTLIVSRAIVRSCDHIATNGNVIQLDKVLVEDP